MESLGNLYNLPDLRIKEKPRTTHPDFEFICYQNTSNTNHTGYLFGILANGYSTDFNNKYYGDIATWPKGRRYFIVYKWPAIMDSIDLNLLLTDKIGSPALGKTSIIKAYEEKKNELGL